MAQKNNLAKLIAGIFSVLNLAERLKFEMRHSWLSNGERESVADHTWQMALMAVLMQRHLEHPVEVERTLKMVVLHDLVEAESGDVPFFEDSERKRSKARREQDAIRRLCGLLDGETGQEVFDLWQEFEAGATPEARFARALDNLEVQMQHNRAPFDTWEAIEYDLVYNKMDKHCQHDAFLNAFCQAVKAEAEARMQAGGVDVQAVKNRAGLS